ncbi:GntR family transcriptional regulator [Microvirga antarctica]|uniref:GntR family transcriptional regulator n=1 Tax=Microvirga antarctica TaxID=2819233 RepID=UPI001B303301|nr:GntR family transcriptional regulator [Microvirga antarctica]
METAMDAHAVTSTRGQVAYQRLRELILDGSFPAGTPLQETMLAARIGVSRTPIREALAQLISEGLVSRVSGLTPVVRRLSVEDFVEILHLRRLLEVEAAGRAAGSGQSGDLRAIRERLVSFLAGEQPTTEDHIAIDDRLHTTIAELSGSKLLTQFVQDLRLRTKVFDKGRLPGRFVPGCQEHIAIIDAVLAADAPAAEAAMRRHIDNVRESIMGYLHRF